MYGRQSEQLLRSVRPPTVLEYRCRRRPWQQGVEGAALKTAGERVPEGPLETDEARIAGPLRSELVERDARWTAYQQQSGPACGTIGVMGRRMHNRPTRCLEREKSCGRCRVKGHAGGSYANEWEAQR